MKAFQPIKSSISDEKGPMPIVFLEKRSAEIWAEDHNEDWTDYKVKEVDLREFTHDEGAVGQQLVKINRDKAIDLIKERAIRKLTDEERNALSLKTK